MSVAASSITIDGRGVTARAGDSIRAAAESVGIEIPTVCYHPNMTPANACRVCVVEVEGSRALVPACSRGVEPGMRITTRSERVDLSRRLILEFLASTVDLSTAAGLQGLLREYSSRPERFGVSAPEPAPQVDNELYVRDYSKCILCYRCVQACGPEAQNTFAIWVAGRGGKARIATEFDSALPDSACVYCGNCIEVCPTGALMFKTEFDLRQTGTWAEERQTKTSTICPYCGVGCSLELTVQDNEIVRVNSPAGNDITRGNLCVKGRFGYQFVGQGKPTS